MISINKIFFQENKMNVLNILMISLLPSTLLMGSAIINIVTVLISFFFIIEILRTKKLYFFKNYIFYLLIFFWISLIINIIINQNFETGSLRVFGFIKFIILVFSIKYFLLYKKSKYQKVIFKSWLLIFLIVTFDLYFQHFFGSNILGQKSIMNGRLSGFLGEELKIGHYYSGFLLLSISIIFYNYGKGGLIYILLCAIFIYTSLLIGERANFIRVLFIFFIFFILAEKQKILKKAVMFFLVLGIIILTVSQNSGLKLRFWNQFLAPLTKVTINEYFQNSHYGAHYKTAINIFLKNPITGVGIKNFRNESKKKEYIPKNFTFKHFASSTHPHQVHLEFLSETGIIGYFSFLLFFLIIIFVALKSFFKNKNLYLLSSILFIISSLMPILPTGSFFTTYGATIFWVNFAVMITYLDLKKNSC